MKKVYQTVVDRNHGNCMQAAIASLLELELEEVPNFIETEKEVDREFDKSMVGWLYKNGYEPCFIFKARHSTDMLKRIAEFDGGKNGYFYAAVPSSTFENCSHAVIVDKNLNVVHDPNPNQKALELKPEEVEGIMVMHDMVIGKTGKLFKKADWETATEEERDANTYHVKYDENRNIIGTY
jgi:hypothetical protein